MTTFTTHKRLAVFRRYIATTSPVDPNPPTYHRSNILGSLDLYSDKDLSNLPPDTTIDELYLNGELYRLVAAGQFSAAERTRLKLVSNGLYVEPRASYAKVALGCLRSRRLSGERGQRMAEYKTWLELVPDRERFSSMLPKSGSPFKAIVHELTHREAPAKFLPFLTHTGLVVSSKGYAQHHFLSLARLIILNSSPDSSNLGHLLRMEHIGAQYEKDHEKPSNSLACSIRCALIELFVQRGWLWKSVALLVGERAFGIPDRTYQAVLDGIKGTRYAKSTEKILKRWKQEKEKNLLGGRSDSSRIIRRHSN